MRADQRGSAPSELTVAVIGSARLTPPDPRSALAEQIGEAIATKGWTIMTGGYGGLMAVASRAAAKAGGKVIGLPMSGWTELQPNEWNHELRWSNTYPERLAHLLAADAVVVLDGGIGTLSEAAVVWAALQTEPGAAELIFLGAGWPPVLESLAAHLAIDERDLALVTICADTQLVIAHIAQNHAHGHRTASPRG
ncbi:MAG TPA: LOG family protein [Streptosporangiaceae bacterium]|nr:LOG family protein [Streptosporangiaceae bacterium]